MVFTRYWIFNFFVIKVENYFRFLKRGNLLNNYSFQCSLYHPYTIIIRADIVHDQKSSSYGQYDFYPTDDFWYHVEELLLLYLNWNYLMDCALTLQNFYYWN